MNESSRRHWLCGFLLAATTSLVQAQQSTELEEITVTATRREASLQNTPAAISTATGAELQAIGVTDVQGLDALVPSAQFTTLRQQTLIYMRGIGQSLSAPNADPAIAVNVNDVYIPAEMSGSAFYDLDRVEVLPGPQGTLYGRNAAGGVVNVITKRPGHDFGGDATIEAGNYGEVNATAAMDLPVTDDLAFRLAGNRNRHDGYFSNGAMDRDTTSGRLSGLYSPDDATSIYLVGSFSHDGGIGLADQNNPPLGGNWYLPFNPKDNNIFNEANTTTASLQANHRFDNGAELTYLAGYDHLDGANNVEFLLGLTPTDPATVLGLTHSRLVTQEARLSGKWGPVDWLTGLYYYNGDVYFSTNSVIAEPVHILNGPFNQKSDGYAAFMQGELALNDRTKLTSGLRYSNDSKDFTGSNSLLSGTAPLSYQPYTGEHEWNRVDWRVAADYAVTSDSMLYGSVQTGYNQGGFSTTPINPNDPQAALFEPEKVLAYTLGSKNKFFANHAIANLEAFYYDYDNYQVSARNLVTAQNQVFNAQKARIYGADLSTEFVMAEYGRLHIDASYLQAKATTLVLPVAPFTNYSGFDLPYAPRVSTRAGYTYTWQLGSRGSLDADASYRWVDGMWGVYNHLNGSFIPSHSFTDASLTFHSADEKWSFALWGRNLTNTFTFQLLNGSAIPGPGAGFPEAPRTYGIRLTARF
jgi:iron complex outermembrane receptor protein